MEQASNVKAGVQSSSPTAADVGRKEECGEKTAASAVLKCPWRRVWAPLQNADLGAIIRILAGRRFARVHFLLPLTPDEKTRLLNEVGYVVLHSVCLIVHNDDGRVLSLLHLERHRNFLP